MARKTLGRWGQVLRLRREKKVLGSPLRKHPVRHGRQTVQRPMRGVLSRANPSASYSPLNGLQPITRTKMKGLKQKVCGQTPSADELIYTC